MKNTVKIKSYQNGLTIYLDELAPFSNILLEIKEKFAQSSSFFGSAVLPLCIEGRKLTEDEEYLMIETIERESRVKIPFIVEKISPEYFDNGYRQFNPGQQNRKDGNFEEEHLKEEINIANTLNEDDVTFHRKSVLPGETIECAGDLVIWGNVSKDATVLSKKSIIIYGGLYGEAYAGADNGEDYFIAALDFEPQKLMVGDIEMKDRKNYPKWKKKNNFNAQMAYVKNSSITLIEITKELLEQVF